MTARSVVVDGLPVGRLGGVDLVVPRDDNRHAWILASTYGRAPGWAVLEWSLDDGRVATLREGGGNADGIAARGGRVFCGHPYKILWEDVDGGASGAVAVERSCGFDACSPDGRYLSIRRSGYGPSRRYQVRSVEGDGEPFPEVPALLVFSDDSCFAAHLGEDGLSLRWISLEDRATASIEIGASRTGWRGIRAVRGAARMIAWDAEQIVICDLAGRNVVAQVGVESIESVRDVAARRILIDTGRRCALDVLDLDSGRRVPLAPANPQSVLTPDGRVLRVRRPLLEVVDATSGAVLSPHDGHSAPLCGLVFSRDDAALASSARDGRVRVLHLAGTKGVTEIEGERGEVLRLAWCPDGRRICTVTESEIAVADAMNGAIVARYPSWARHIGSAEISADGRFLVAGAYGDGIRVVELTTGRQVMAECEATKLLSDLVLVDDDILVLCRGWFVGPELRDPVALVHWVRLDLAGAIRARGTWRFEDSHATIQLRADSFAATFALHGCLRTFALRAPDEPVHEVSIPLGARLLDAREGRTLFCEDDELVRRDPRTGAETGRIHCMRPPTFASLSHDGNAVAVAYFDGGVEVFELGSADRVENVAARA